MSSWKDIALSAVRAPRRAACSRPTWRLGAVCLTAACLTPCAAAVSAGESAPARAPRAASARVLSVNDTGYLHLANPSSASSTLVEEGRATGTLPGTVRARLGVGTSTVRVAFTIYLRNGTIVGHGTASLNPGKGEFASFGGSIAVSHGSGHYAHASGTGRVYGTINRNTDNAVVQVQGQLHL